MTLIVPALAERLAMFALPSAAPDRAAAILPAARLLLPMLERGQAIDAITLRAAMEAAFGVSDTGGAWMRKDAYEACEATQVVFLRPARATTGSLGGPARRGVGHALRRYGRGVRQPAVLCRRCSFARRRPDDGAAGGRVTGCGRL